MNDDLITRLKTEAVRDGNAATRARMSLIERLYRWPYFKAVVAVAFAAGMTLWIIMVSHG